MQKLVKNNWQREQGMPYARARILRHDIHPEGLNVDGIRFFESGRFEPLSAVAHIVSILRGEGRLNVGGGAGQSLRVGEGIHLFLPPGLESVLDAEPGTELLHVSGASSSQARGKKFLLRDETFLSACASGTHSLRWILTPQYLSRRVFLHHDPILLSKSGNPVAWFRTTMFDVAGLPENEEGEPVFKMSYNSRTEANFCFDVEGLARVRMALHPYRGKNQVWGPWHQLDGESTYHLNEAAGGPEEECIPDETTRNPQFLRNKHEVHIIDGHVTLCCLFDPAPTGVERHRPGEYSDYESLSQVLGTEAYETHQREIARYDEMVDRLSFAKAAGTLESLKGTPLWELYLQGRERQVAIERELASSLVAAGNGREKIITRWMQSPVAG